MAPDAKEDIRFDVYFSSEKKDEAAFVVNTLPSVGTEPGFKFGTLFIFGEDGKWMMIPDDFVP